MFLIMWEVTENHGGNFTKYLVKVSDTNRVMVERPRKVLQKRFLTSCGCKVLTEHVFRKIEDKTR